MGVLEAKRVPSMSPLFVLTMIRISDIAEAFVANGDRIVTAKRAKSSFFIPGIVPLWRMSQQKVNIGLVQHRCTLNRMRTSLPPFAGARGRQQAPQIICLQELFRSVYFCQIEDHKYFDLAEEIPAPRRRFSRIWPRNWAW